MADTLISVDLSDNPLSNEKIHNRWHPDIPIAVWVERGDLLVVEILDIGAKEEMQWGFNGFFSKQNGGGFLTGHFPEAQNSI